MDWPGREAFFKLRVLGVVNREILNGVAFGVVPNNDAFSPLVGEPASLTLVGENGRLAGDWSKEALNAEF